MWSTLTPVIIYALIGGAIGSLRSVAHAKNKATPWQSLFNLLSALALAAAAAERFVKPDTPLAGLFIGITAGATGGYALDALTALTPKAIASIVSGALEKIGCKPIDADATSAPNQHNADVK